MRRHCSNGLGSDGAQTARPALEIEPLPHVKPHPMLGLTRSHKQQDLMQIIFVYKL